ncbi:hypothetical protein Droror1_Dr00009413 [Drosera rotundifolia]
MRVQGLSDLVTWSLLDRKCEIVTEHELGLKLFYTGVYDALWLGIAYYKALYPSVTKKEKWSWIVSFEVVSVLNFESPFEFSSSREERKNAKNEKRNEYDRLRKQCHSLHATMTAENKSGSAVEARGSNASDSRVNAKDLFSMEKESPASEHSATHSPTLLGRPSCSEQVQSSTAGPSNRDTESSDSDMLDVDEITKDSPMELDKDNVDEMTEDSQMDLDKDNIADVVATLDARPDVPRADSFNTWQKTIRLDAQRAGMDWVEHSPWQAAIPHNRALLFSEDVGLEGYSHLEPCRIYHAARLVAILEAYAIHDNEIGYCQGMSDLLAPIVAMLDDDSMAFWCFVGSMKKARQNFRHNGDGIQQQLDFISKIIKHKDDQLYSHLKQTVQLWEVMWADQAAVKAWIEKSAESVIQQQAPPTDDLLLYVIAASVLQRRKRIIEEHSSMDEIHLECNNMSGQLDIWKLLDDARDLVITLHDKIKFDV